MLDKKEFNIEFVNDSIVCNQLFDEVPLHLKPSWLCLILTYFNVYFEDAPEVALEFISIMDNDRRWFEMNEFSEKITEIRLNNTNTKLNNYYLYLENAAKISIKVFEGITTFDPNTGYELVNILNSAAQDISDDHFIIYDLEIAFTLFKYELSMSESVKTAADFLIFKKIDKVLWFDWDPLSLNQNWIRHEYMSYIKEILKLVKEDVPTEGIAYQIYQLEVTMFNLRPFYYNCLKIAQKIK